MKTQKQCFACIEKLTDQALEMAFAQHNQIGQDEKNTICRQIQAKLRDDFSLTKVPAAIFSRINRDIKKLTGIEDAFLERKKQEIANSRNIASRIRESLENDIQSLLLFSAKGNSLDFFKTLEESEKDMLQNAVLAIDQSGLFQEKLKEAKTIAFFADNSGEVFFDLPLLEFLSGSCKVYYIVKSSPVQNDLSIKEINAITDILIPCEIVASGNDAVGVDWETISQELREITNRADLIIAKGMGNYETFSELNHFQDKVFHLLMAKCNPVAESLGVKLHSYVFTKS